MMRMILMILLLTGTSFSPVFALGRPEIEFKIFQFPRNMIPCIDGKTNDWDIVGEEYTYRTDQLDGTTGGFPDGKVDPNDIDVKVRVGWVKDLNRLYFLYEAYDDYWDFGIFDGGGYQNDIFEIIVDGDISGGQIIHNAQIKDRIENHFRYSGVHGQNYHIFTPPVNNQWCIVWGSQPWICRFPWANYTYDYNFKPGESGNLVLEFWITPFDYAPYDGPERSVISRLEENVIIGLNWAILDFDNGKKNGIGNSNLAHERSAVSEASALCAFRLMPLEKSFEPAIEARWSFKIIDMDRRLVYFKDESLGNITSWLWHFGDGDTSTEQFPIHRYEKPGFQYTVWLDVEGPDGKSRHSKHWDVMLK